MKIRIEGRIIREIKDFNGDDIEVFVSSL